MKLDSAAGGLRRSGARRFGARGFASWAPIRHLDPTLLLTACALTVFGALMVYSASSHRLTADGLSPRQYLDRQVTFAVIGVVGMVVVSSFTYRRIKAWGPIFYGFIFFLLLFVLSPFGSASKGAQRWISFGFFQLQPSEVMKVAVIGLLAVVLSERRGEPGVREVVRCCLLVGGPALFIYLQPDLGTLLVLLAILFGMLLVSGVPARILVVMVLLGVAVAAVVLQLGLLHDYQVDRLTAFLDPSRDPQRTGYNLQQAMIAVGSGQLVGKGLFSGSQTNLDFVPEVHTDFIFTAVGEELGFVGSVGLLALFTIFLWRGIRIAMMSKDTFGALLAAGIVSMFAFQVFVNVGMTIGISPITGIPLPFVSYGGSHLLTTFLATGILLNIHMRRGV